MSSSVACLAAVDLAIGCLQPSAFSEDQLGVYTIYGKDAASCRPIGVKDRGKDVSLKLRMRESDSGGIQATVVESLERHVVVGGD